MFKLIFAKKEPSLTPIPQRQAICPHTVLIPAWDDAEDMGREQKASRFTCESCHQEFTLVEGLALRKAESGRLNQELLGGTEQTPTN